MEIYTIILIIIIFIWYFLWILLFLQTVFNIGEKIVRILLLLYKYISILCNYTKNICSYFINKKEDRIFLEKNVYYGNNHSMFIIDDDNDC